MESTLVHDLNSHNTEKYYTSWRDIRLAEAAEIHLKWLNTRAYDYGDEVRDMLIQGTKISAVNYICALRTIREQIRKEFLSILSHKVNVIIVPTTIIPIGLTKDNMPVGAQIIGPPLKEEIILSIAYNYEGMNNSMNKFIPPCVTKEKDKL